MAVKDFVSSLRGTSDPTWLSNKGKDNPMTFQMMYDSIKGARNVQERQWYLNLAFYFGRQYVGWINSGPAWRLYEPPVPPWRVRLVDNKCKTIVRTELSKMTKERPRGYVVPNTSDDMDKAAARAAGKLYDALEIGLKLPAVDRDALFWCSVLGNGYTKNYYNKDKKDFTGANGALVVESLSPFSVHVPDQMETDIENQAFLIHEAAYPVDELYKIYREKVVPDSTGATLDARFMNAMGITNQPTQKTHANVKEIWIKACAEYPNGCRAMFTQNVILDMDESKWAYDHAQYPFTKYNSVITGRYYNDSILVDVLPLQKEWNRTISQIVEIKNGTSKPQLLVQKGSIDPNMVTNEPGLMIEYLPGVQIPTVINPPSVPHYVMELLDRIQLSLDDITSQHETTRGTTPGSVTAATAISYLQEADDSKLSGTIASIEEGKAKTASQLLSLVNQFWGTDRMIKVIGESDSYEVKAFNKSTLRGNTDYRVEIGSAVPRSRAAKQAFLLELQQRQAITNPQLLSRLDMAEASDFYADMQKDDRQASRENMIMQEGYKSTEKGNKSKVLPTNPYDNHIIHIGIHQNFEKTEQFENMKPELQQAHLDHVMLHKTTVCGMYGRMDLIPTPLTDPRNGEPVLDEMGKPRMGPTNPQLDGFIEAVTLHGPPPIPPPMQAQLPIGETVAPDKGQSQSQPDQNGSPSPTTG